MAKACYGMNLGADLAASDGKVISENFVRCAAKKCSTIRSCAITDLAIALRHGSEKIYCVVAHLLRLRDRDPTLPRKRNFILRESRRTN